MEIPARGQIIDESFAEPIPAPDQINTDRHFWSAFNNSETEVSANYLVRLAQRSGSWKPFTLEEIEALYNESGHQRFTFNWLIRPAWVVDRPGADGRYEGGGWIIEQDNKLHYTTDFVERVFKSSSKQPDNS